MSDKRDRLLTIFGLRASPSEGRAFRAGLMLLALPAGYAFVGGFGDAPILRFIGCAVFLGTGVGFFWNFFWHLD